MLSFDEALALTLALARPLPAETVALAEAAGRVLAVDLVAPRDSPAAPTSAMDGYAARDADVAQSGAALKVIGQSLPGAPYCGDIGPGEAVRIFTGAALPAGSDRIVIQEVVRREGDIAHVADAVRGPRHVRQRASDFAAGDVLLAAGTLLTPQAMVAAACADLAGVEVVARPRLALIATGDELAPPGQARGAAHAIPESVSFGVAALAEAHGARVVSRVRIGDEPALLISVAGEALIAADIVVVTGGASVGERDFAKAMFEPHGLKLVFSKVAIKPGKPVWIGRAAGKLVVGLPGNPTSAMVTARLFLAPLLAGHCGRDPKALLDWRALDLAAPLPPPGDRETFVRAELADGRASPLSDQDSGAQRALARANLLIRRPAGATASVTGEAVDVLDF